MRRLATLLLFVLIAAKVALVLARGPVSLERDAAEYWRLSSLVMDGDVLMLDEPIAYRTPGYPYFLAVIRLAAGPWALMTVVVVQGALAFASVVIAAHLSGKITGLPRARLLTYLASLPAISALTFSATVLSESLFVFLLMLNLWILFDYSQLGTKTHAALVGVTFGLTLLTRPIVLMLWTGHLFFLLTIQYRQWRKLRGTETPDRVRLHHRFAHFGLMFAVVMLMCAPWLARNQHLFGSPKLTEFIGRNIWIVTFQDGSGAGLPLPESEAGLALQSRLNRFSRDDRWRHTWTVSNTLTESGLNDAQADRLMKQVSFDAIDEFPTAFAARTVRRLANFWRCAATDLPQQGSVGEFFDQKVWEHSLPAVDWTIDQRLSQFVWANTGLTFLIGSATLLLMFNRPTRPYGVWLFLVFSYFTIVTGVLEIPAYRYRIVVEPLAATAIGSAVAVLWSRRRVTVAVEEQE